MGRVCAREMLGRCLIITLFCSFLSMTTSATASSDIKSRTSDETKEAVETWLDSIFGLTTRDLRSDKERDLFWATRGKRMADGDDFWAIRGKKANVDDYFPIKRGLKPNGLFSSIKRAKEFIKRPNLKPNGLFSSFKRSQDFVNDEDELYNSGLLYDSGNKREDFWAARGKRGEENFWATRG